MARRESLSRMNWAEGWLGVEGHMHEQKDENLTTSTQLDNFSPQVNPKGVILLPESAVSY